MNWIFTILQFVAPVVISFFTPERCKAVITAVLATIDFISQQHAEKSADEQYALALAFATAQYDLLDSVAGLDETVDKTAKETLLPFILGFIYGTGGDHD